MADASIGEVAITLDGKEVTLRSSLAAAKRINAAGGFRNVADRLDAFDMDYYSLVVGAGLGKTPAEVENAVYEAGVAKLHGPAGLFVTYLANGGKPYVAPGAATATGEA